MRVNPNSCANEPERTLVKHVSWKIFCKKITKHLHSFFCGCRFSAGSGTWGIRFCFFCGIVSAEKTDVDFSKGVCLRTAFEAPRFCGSLAAEVRAGVRCLPVSKQPEAMKFIALRLSNPTQGRRYAFTGSSVDKAEILAARFLACLCVSLSRHRICGREPRGCHSITIAPPACYSRVCAQIWDAVLGLPRGLAETKSVRPAVQRQRLPNDERPGRSHLPA